MFQDDNEAIVEAIDDGSLGKHWNEKKLMKKYQIFISSTYEDLKEERRFVRNAISESNKIYDEVIVCPDGYTECQEKHSQMKGNRYE